MKLTKRSAVPNAYSALLADLKARIQSAQVRAPLAVNRELVMLYWDIGNEINRRQKEEGWGAKVIETLARDFEAQLPLHARLLPS